MLYVFVNFINVVNGLNTDCMGLQITFPLAVGVVGCKRCLNPKTSGLTTDENYSEKIRSEKIYEELEHKAED